MEERKQLKGIDFTLVMELVIDIRKQAIDNGFTFLIPFPILILEFSHSI